MGQKTLMVQYFQTMTYGTLTHPIVTGECPITRKKNSVCLVKYSNLQNKLACGQGRGRGRVVKSLYYKNT